MDDLETRFVLEGWVNTQQFNLAKEESSKLGKSVWSVLIKLGFVSEEGIAVFFGQESGFAYIKIADYEISPLVISLIQEEYCREHTLIPLFKIRDTLYVVFSNPLDTTVVDNLVKMLGYSIEPLISTSRSINQALNSYYGPEEKNFTIEKFLFKQSPLQGISFKRESERLSLNIPVSLKLIDKPVVLKYTTSIEGNTRNISESGTAVSLQVPVFLPKGIKIALDFKPNYSLFEAGCSILATGEIIHCCMERNQRYKLGVRFIEIKKKELDCLFKLAKKF